MSELLQVLLARRSQQRSYENVVVVNVMSRVPHQIHQINSPERKGHRLSVTGKMSFQIPPEEKAYQLARPNETSVDGLIAYNIAGLCVVEVAVMLRFWSRKMQKTPFKADDYCLLAAAVWVPCRLYDALTTERRKNIYYYCGKDEADDRLGSPDTRYRPLHLYCSEHQAWFWAPHSYGLA